MTGSFPRVSVLVLNLNGRQYLDACLSSLQEQLYPKDRFEVVVVDNGSTDESLA
jgi:glycosyltransferase involved in cell wall biosynthesis